MVSNCCKGTVKILANSSPGTVKIRKESAKKESCAGVGVVLL